MHARSLSSLEIESYRVLVFESVLKGMRGLIIAMGDLHIDVGGENKVSSISSPNFSRCTECASNPPQALLATCAKCALQYQGGRPFPTGPTRTTYCTLV